MRTVRPQGRTFRITQPHGLRVSYLGTLPGLCNRSNRIVGAYRADYTLPYETTISKRVRRKQWIGSKEDWRRLFEHDRRGIMLSRMPIFYDATLCRPHPSAGTRQLGRHSFGPTWRCWWGLTSSRAEVLTLRGLLTYYVLFFIHLQRRRVDIAGITVQPDEPWMQQIARNVTMEGCGALRDCRYLLHDRDTKFTQSFRAIIASGRVEPLAQPELECLFGALGQISEGGVPGASSNAAENQPFDGRFKG
jgi:hypothetical protein